VHPDLEETIAFHESVLAEGGKALVGYDLPKILANVVLLSEIPTTYDKKEQRQVNSGNLLLRGVPGVGKTFFGVILAAISNAKFARIQGRADMQPTEVVGFQMINPATGEFMTEFGPLASAEVILLDEINRIPLKSQSAFLEGLQDRSITVGKETYDLPAFSFAMATMNPVELGQGTFPLSEAATDRFAIMVNIGYLPPEEEQKLVNFDFKRVRLNPLMSKERIIQLRGRSSFQSPAHQSLCMLRGVIEGGGYEWPSGVYVDSAACGFRQIMMAMETRLDRDGVHWEMPKGTAAELAALTASYQHLTKMRDEVVAMGVLPPLARWSEVNPNL